MRVVLHIYMLLFGLLIGQSAVAQINWTKYATPVLSRSALFPNWKGLATGDACVMYENDTLKMWYSGVGWLNAADACPHVRMGYAWSLDGISWNEYVGNPVLDISTDTSKFDADGIETPTVIKDVTAPPDQRYKLWYAGRKARCQPTNDHKIGYAYSPDGINWTKYPGNPVLVPGNAASWYNTFVSGPSVLLDSGMYKMWFTASDLVLNGQPTDGKGNIGYASSADGISWTIHPSPVLVAGVQRNWDSASVAEPAVVKVGSSYYMFYSALDKWAIENFQVGFATSTDGINWNKSNQNPVLRIGSPGKWDRYWATHPGVMYDWRTNRLRMWFTGRDTATIGSLSGYYWDIGYAESFLIPDPNGGIASAIAVFPNPAQSLLNVYLSVDVTNAEMSIYNESGQLQKVFSAVNNRSTTIDINNLSSGLYFIVVKIGNRKYSSKFIISR